MDIRASADADKCSAMCILTLDPEEREALALDFLAKIEALECTVQISSRNHWNFRILAESNLRRPCEVLTHPGCKIRRLWFSDDNSNGRRVHAVSTGDAGR